MEEWHRTMLDERVFLMHYLPFCPFFLYTCSLLGIIGRSYRCVDLPGAPEVKAVEEGSDGFWSKDE